jgi:hypothetical protein
MKWIATWFSNFFENALVSRVNRRMLVRMVRFWRSTKLVAMSVAQQLESDAHAVALRFTSYDFCRIHKTLPTTPATAAGATDRLWKVADIVSLIEAEEAVKDGPLLVG